MEEIYPIGIQKILFLCKPKNRRLTGGSMNQFTILQLLVTIYIVVLPAPVTNARRNLRIISQSQKDIVTTGYIFIGLLTLERQFDSKLSRVFQEYLPVEKAPNTFEQPNQQEQIQKASIKDTLLRLSTSLQEKFTVPIDIFGRIQ